MDIEVEATVEGKVACPYCGKEFLAHVTGETTVTIEPDDERGDPD